MMTGEPLVAAASVRKHSQGEVVVKSASLASGAPGAPLSKGNPGNHGL